MALLFLQAVKAKKENFKLVAHQYLNGERHEFKNGPVLFVIEQSQEQPRTCLQLLRMIIHPGGRLPYIKDRGAIHRYTRHF